jgi:peptidoglycan/xylan/chitin deacetylase (PgdA/CDA1 family)
MAGLSASGQATEMDRATAEQTRAVGMPPCAFRPPYGYPDYNSTTERLAQQRRMKFWTWSSRGGYLVLTANGGVHNYGAPFYGSARGTLPAGVTAVGLAANPATGGYWILTSDGGVAQYHAPWYGSVKHDGLRGLTVTAISGE